MAQGANADVRYIAFMFEVLVYVYENYWQGDACPELDRLGRKLTAAGFDSDEIVDALTWLDGLNLAAHGTEVHPARPVSEALRGQHGQTPSSQSLRVYSAAEQTHLGAESLGFVSFLACAGVLPSPMQEIVIDRAMAAPGDPVALDDLKIIILMVYWSFGEEPDALVLDELCDDASLRRAH